MPMQCLFCKTGLLLYGERFCTYLFELPNSYQWLVCLSVIPRNKKMLHVASTIVKAIVSVDSYLIPSRKNSDVHFCQVDCVVND